MKRLDDGKVSLVDFMRSIKFARAKHKHASAELKTHFAHFDPQARSAETGHNTEECNLVRSAN